MRETIKTFCILGIITGCITAAVAWTLDRPDTLTWIFRTAAPILALFATALFLKIHFRPDDAPDYLKKVNKQFFNRGGFCFSIVPNSIDGVAYLDAFFQSHFDNPSIGRIALRPARGFFLTRAKFDAITFEIECPPGGFGFVRVALPIPLKRQGKKQAFEVGASVEYPQGKGKQIRFRDGIGIRTNSNFGDAFATAVTLLALTGGNIVLTKPATTSLLLPDNVTEEMPDIPPDTNIIWQLGDPELDFVS